MEEKKGFTLVELIVVLVILAILAAIMVPSLVGFIDKAKEKKYILEAKNCMNAMQAELVEMYGQDDTDWSSYQPTNKNNGGDVVWINQTPGKKILKTANVDPHMLIIGTGKDTEYRNDPKNYYKEYTVYFVAYWPEPAKTEDPIFYNGSEWTKEYPWEGRFENTFKVNGEDIKMQFYFIDGPFEKQGEFYKNWNALQDKVGLKQHQ